LPPDELYTICTGPDKYLIEEDKFIAIGNNPTTSRLPKEPSVTYEPYKI
jgi:hypothetical protein